MNLEILKRMASYNLTILGMIALVVGYLYLCSYFAGLLGGDHFLTAVIYIISYLTATSYYIARQEIQLEMESTDDETTEG
jgi:hypothetical protein